MSENDLTPFQPAGPMTTAQGAATVGRRILAGPAYRRLLRGVYQPSHLAVDHGLRIMAARARIGDGPVIVGVSAAWALGCRLADPDTPVHVMVRSGARSSAGLATHRGVVPECDVVATELGRATSPERTAVDLARGFGGTETADLGARVAWVDALVRRTSLTAARVRQATADAPPARGIRGARTVAAAVRDGVDSFRESDVRMLLRAEGVPEPVVQCTVRDRHGRVIARLDLGWPDHGVGLEYDGAVHRDFLQHSRDLARHNRIRDAGWRVLQVDARSFRSPGEFLRQLRSWLAATESPPTSTL